MMTILNAMIRDDQAWQTHQKIHPLVLILDHRRLLAQLQTRSPIFGKAQVVGNRKYDDAVCVSAINNRNVILSHHTARIIEPPNQPSAAEGIACCPGSFRNALVSIQQAR
ncbi:MAG: hypothetical protein RQ899_06775 [Pseudomonadales bacterium]|nr:hypothetical protein [Pseudomonadales bacterium]